MRVAAIALSYLGLPQTATLYAVSGRLGGL